MANQWDFIDIADDDDEEIGRTDDENIFGNSDLHEVNVLGRPISGKLNYVPYDEDSVDNDSLSRSQYYWSPEATKLLISLRSEREAEFELGGPRKSQLWVDIAKRMQMAGHDFSPEKVSKKWHNIMITYNKNIVKKCQTGGVSWEFFDDIDKIYKGRRSSLVEEQIRLNAPPLPITLYAKRKMAEETNYEANDNSANSKIPKHINNNEHSNLNHDRQADIEYKKSKYADSIELPSMYPTNMMDELEDHNSTNEQWWKDYFNKKLELEKEKMRIDVERHKEMMLFQRNAMCVQEKFERMKIEALNKLTGAIIQLAGSKR